MDNEMFKNATDWVVELTPGVGFRYACPRCLLMPACAYHWWRLSHVEGLGGSTSHGCWAAPCCGE
eukprot:55520-Lingulodinium_polyedra.AAC.1